MGGPVPALEYHRLTVHQPGHPYQHDDRLVEGYRPMVWERKPPQFKTYPGREVLPLPEDLDADWLGRLLFLSAGVTRRMEMGGRTMWFRAAGSAGNLSPIEVYVVRGAGVFHYEPVEHGLVRLSDAPAGAPPALVLTGVPWRTCWKYRERGFRHLWWDAGTMLAHVLALVPEARVEVGFVDTEVAALVGAQAPYELPLAVVSLNGEPSALPRQSSGGDVPAGHLADDPLEFPLVTDAFATGVLASQPDVISWREAAADAGSPVGPGAGLYAAADLAGVIRRRGSTRWFDLRRSAPEGLVHADLGWAAGGVRGDFIPEDRSLLEHYLLLFGVDGLDAGGYRWNGDGLTELATGDLRDAGRHLCLDQPLGGDGAFTAFSCADLGAVTSALGDRGYRAANLEAGVVEGRLHLAAYSRGLGATGLTFYDDEVSRFFATTSAPLLVTAVGAPGYRSRPGGPPRRPVEMVGR
ncbi:MAG: hypothetical protein ACRD0Q_07105 [Acidimicrobiales bacterium]